MGAPQPAETATTGSWEEGLPVNWVFIPPATLLWVSWLGAARQLLQRGARCGGAGRRACQEHVKQTGREPGKFPTDLQVNGSRGFMVLRASPLGLV